MNLARENEKWKKFWDETVDVSQVERQLTRLRMLEEFAFHCGPEITPEMFNALEQQIAAGERKLAELRGDFVPAIAIVAQQPEWVNR